MKALMEVPIKKEGGGICFARLKVDLPFLPYVGMPVYHVAWKDSRDVIWVSMQFDEDNEASIMVRLESEHTDNKEQQNQLLEQYKAHGWETIG